MLHERICAELNPPLANQNPVATKKEDSSRFRALDDLAPVYLHVGIRAERGT